MNMWTIGALVIGALITFLIAKFGYGKKIGEWAGLVDEVGTAAGDMMDVVTDSFKPDADGAVRLTGEEVANIYDAIDDLLELVGLDLPDWPGKGQDL